MRLQKRDVWKLKKKEREVKRCIYQSKNEINEQLGRKINKDVGENKMLLWKEVSKVNGGKVETCSEI